MASEDNNEPWALLNIDVKETPTKIDKGKRRASKSKQQSVSFKKEVTVEKSTGNTDGVDERNSTSPEPSCAICLCKIENKAFADGCYHSFCKTCLFEWSKVKPECPVCRQSFFKILHNVRTMADYDVFDVPRKPCLSYIDRLELIRERAGHVLGPTMPTLTREGASYRIGISFRNSPSNQSSRLRVNLPYTRGAVSASVGLNYPFFMRDRTYSAFPPVSGTSEYRQYVYNFNLWAKIEETNRFRETSPTFYKDNPAVTHRVQAFVNRELVALIPDSDEVARCLERISTNLLEFPILSISFRRVIEPFFLERTGHFIHELFHFARSPLDMSMYDRTVVHLPRLRVPKVYTTEESAPRHAGVNYEEESTRSERSTPPCYDILDSETEEDSLDSIQVNTPDIEVEIEESSSRPITPTSPEQVLQNLLETEHNSDNPTPGPSGVRIFPNFHRYMHDTSLSDDGSIDVGKTDHESQDIVPLFEEDSTDSIIVLDQEKRLLPLVIDISSDSESDSNVRAVSLKRRSSELMELARLPKNTRISESPLQKPIIIAPSRTPSDVKFNLRSVVIPIAGTSSRSSPLDADPQSNAVITTFRPYLRSIVNHVSNMDDTDSD